MKKRWKKLLSVTLSACMAMPFISAVPAAAESKKNNQSLVLGRQ